MLKYTPLVIIVCNGNIVIYPAEYSLKDLRFPLPQSVGLDGVLALDIPLDCITKANTK